MKSLAVVLLAYLIAISIIAYFSPIPFLGLAAGFLMFPMALKLSRIELFSASLTQILFGMLLKIDFLIAQINMGQAMLNNLGFGAWAYTLWIIFFPMFILISIIYAVFFAFMMKFLSRYTPKRLKTVMMGNP